MKKVDVGFISATFGLFGFLFFHFAKEMLQVRPDGWYVGQVNLYGDLVFHIAFINRFIESGKIIVGSPIYAGSQPNYPIASDFITSVVARFSGIDSALFLVTFAFGIATIFFARKFILHFIENEKVVFLTLLLFFVNGGLGFIYFFNDLQASHKPITEFLLSIPREYTDLKSLGYWWINSLLAYFMPQRAFFMAFPIVLSILLLLYKGWQNNKRKHFIIAGVLTGLLPLVQAHSLFLLFLLCIYFFSIAVTLWKKKIIGNWIIFGVITSVIALPLFKIISSAQNPLEFVRFDPGWTSNENIFWFWLKNLGLFAPVLVASIFWLYKKSKTLFILYFPFLLIFVVSNIYVFQPWEFDNSKLLIYWYFVSTIVVSYFLHENFFKRNLIYKIIANVIVFFMIFSGGLDLFRTFTPITSYQIFSKQDLEIAEMVKKVSPKDALFITASNHNHPIPSLTGRSTLLGFHGWIWSHGLDYQERAQDIKTMYQGGAQAEDLIRKYKVDFVTIGPQERTEFLINEEYFEQYPKLQLALDWGIYDVSALWTNRNR